MAFIIGFCLLIIIAIIIGANNGKKIGLLKDAYDKSLLGTDKRAALEAGRAYYSALRKGKTLTIYDEQAITNDLSTMNVLSVS